MTTLQAMEQARLARREMLAMFRENSYHEITLQTSGLTVFVRDASVTDLMLLGRLPQSLLGILTAEVDKAQGGQVQAGVDLNQFAGSADFGALVDGVVRACMVEPPVADVADDEHLGINEISAADRMQIFTWANREVAQNADTFRKTGNEPVPAAQPRQSGGLRTG